MGANEAPKRGRPTEFEQDIADAICQRISEGESLRRICADEEMPSQSMVFRWLGSVAGFREQYARAREAQADAFADIILDTSLDADLEPNDRRVRVDALKWLASKRKPKVYGDKVQTELTGRDGGPVELKIDKAAVDLMDADELAALERGLVKLQQGAGVRPAENQGEAGTG